MIKIHKTKYTDLHIEMWLEENFDKLEYTLSSKPMSIVFELCFVNDENETFFYLKFGDVSKFNDYGFGYFYSPYIPLGIQKVKV